ncbi:MAG TPA: PH domain-containing protein [Myxococcales bacterium]|nr:PH domain-containing protein [Myxococcales bacterium]
MKTQLHLVDAAPKLAAFRADARLRLCGSGACAGVALALVAAGYRHRIAPVIAGPLAASFLLWSAHLLATFAARAALRYTLTAERLEIEKGLLARRRQSIELWRVRELVLEETLLDRVRGVGRITLVCSGPLAPGLDIGPVAGAHELCQALRSAVAGARGQGRSVPPA